MILDITKIGAKLETDCLLEGKIMPKLSYLVIDAGEVAKNYTELTKIPDTAYKSEILAIEELSDNVRKLHGSVPPEIETWIKGIGLALEDGTLYAYAPYQTESGGFFKGKGFNFSFFTILSRENVKELEFTYSPLDLVKMAEEISKEAKLSIDVFIQSYFINLLGLISGLSKDIQKIQKEVNRTNIKEKI